MGDPVVIGGLVLLGVLLVAGIAWYLKSSSGGGVADRWTSGQKVSRGGATAERKEKRKKHKARRARSGESVAARIVKPLANMLRLGDKSQSRVQEMLVHAGIRKKDAVEIFLGAKIVIALLVPLVAVGVVYVFMDSRGTVDTQKLFMVGCGAFAMGLLMPTWWLRSKAKKRIEAIRLSLPDALDLMIVCVEAGLGLDAALVRISDELTETAPEICEDFTLLNLEISAGKPREECLRNLALRTGCEEVESLSARINQTTKYGTNLGHSLRIHSESLRQKRRQEAEERAAKTTVKLLFPLVFFIFPAIFVVILGPGVIRLVEQFGG